MWYRLDFEDELNFPAAWAALERAFPCADSDRAHWPAFSHTADSRPLSQHAARTALKVAITHCAGPGVAARHQWHDFRATIASAIVGTGKPPALAQALVCWASEESVALYGQMLPEQLADAAQEMSTVDAARHAHLPTPHIDEHTIANTLLSCLESMQSGEQSQKAAPSAQPWVPALVSAPAPALKRPRSSGLDAPQQASRDAPRAAPKQVSLPATARAHRRAPSGARGGTHTLTGASFDLPATWWDAGDGSPVKCRIIDLVDTPCADERVFRVLVPCGARSDLVCPFAASALRGLVPKRLRRYV
jgi:hypothetical protein